MRKTEPGQRWLYTDTIKYNIIIEIAEKMLIKQSKLNGKKVSDGGLKPGSQWYANNVNDRAGILWYKLLTGQEAETQ